MTLNNNLGRPKIVTKYKFVYNYIQEELVPNQDIEMSLKGEVAKKEKALKKVKGRLTLQKDKVERIVENLRHFEK